jgi:hypothetical protein
VPCTRCFPYKNNLLLLLLLLMRIDTNTTVHNFTCCLPPAACYQHCCCCQLTPPNSLQHNTRQLHPSREAPRAQIRLASALHPLLSLQKHLAAAAAAY